MFTARFMTEYALKVVSNRCTLGDAYVAFGTEYPKFYLIYEKVKQTDDLIKASRQLSDASTKIFILSSLGEKVKEITMLLDRFKKESLAYFEKVTPRNEFIDMKSSLNTRYKDWYIKAEYEVNPEYNIRGLGTYHNEYDRESNQWYEIEDTEGYIDGYNRILSIEYWKEGVRKTTYYSNDMYAMYNLQGENMADVQLDNYLNGMLNDIGYTDDLKRQQEQIRKNKGLQIFLYLLQDNIIGR